MAARKGPAFAMSAEHRVKIQNSNILNALIEHATGEREMSATQVSAGLGLLRKVLPDLASVEHSGTIETRRSAELTDDELAAIAAGRGTGTAQAPVDPSQLN
jgi:hypothetical protein